MRTIKFRGKPIEDYGEIKWFYGNLLLSYEDKLAYIEANGQGVVPVEWDSVGQFIGLKDKFGKEIYENDPLFSEGNIDGEDFIGTVTYSEEEARFIVVTPKGKPLFWIPNEDCWVKES